MTTTLLNIGKTDNQHLEVLLADYIKRINRFINFKSEYIITPKNIGKFKPDQIKKIEGDLILKKISEADYVVLLDEKGDEFTSVEFANFYQGKLNTGFKNIFFITGGAYGFSDLVYKYANKKLSMSKMTTTHQLIRLLFTEQLYRALTILKGHPYHNN